VARLGERILQRLGYVRIGEIDQLLVRIGQRLAEVDEPMTREYVLDPYPGGIEHKVRLLCQRRKTFFDRTAQEELAHVIGDTAPRRN
jgi:hypothetical protein